MLQSILLLFDCGMNEYFNEYFNEGRRLLPDTRSTVVTCVQSFFVLKDSESLCSLFQFLKLKLSWQICLFFLPNLPKIKNPLNIISKFKILFPFEMS